MVLPVEQVSLQVWSHLSVSDWEKSVLNTLLLILKKIMGATSGEPKPAQGRR